MSAEEVILDEQDKRFLKGLRGAIRVRRAAAIIFLSFVIGICAARIIFKIDLMVTLPAFWLPAFIYTRWTEEVKYFLRILKKIYPDIKEIVNMDI